jgi:outer membrane receptor protein involved in Fe transport
VHRQQFPFIKSTLASFISAWLSLYALNTQAADPMEEIVIVGVAPGSGIGQSVKRLPFAVKSINFVQLQNSQSLDLTDYMQSKLGSVSINSAQNNPLQPDLQFRGFTASPLLGLPQGIAVYQNGARMNEPLGDAVNWDLLPESAVYSMDLISGANPVFGLNTLGGAMAITMKDGFTFTGNQLEALTGAWGRNTLTLESGNNYALANGSAWGYYVNASLYEEDGWRDLSDSGAQNFYGSLGWRNADVSALDLSYQQGNSELIGNGALPVGQLALDRTAVFTAPDITENDLQAFTLQGSHYASDTFQLSGSLFQRENTTDSFNGDGSEFELCEFSGGAQALLEEPDDIGEALEAALAIDLDDICTASDPATRSFAALETLIEQAALLAGLDPETFELENAGNDLSGTGILSDEGINNISEREQTSQGFTLQGALLDPLLDRPNQLVIGTSWFAGEAVFLSVSELAFMNPLTRSTLGLGTGSFLEQGETDVNTSTGTWSVYFVDTLDVTDKFTLIAAGRYNESDITLRDRSGERPELNGDHNFARFNPSLGFTFNADANTNLYGSYSESNRMPTPIELACNEGVFELARQYASAAGEDPDEIDFECRLPNAFLADPPLDDVVAKSFEFGVRGMQDGLGYQLGYFDATNHDDILFQTTGRATGLFANVEKTRRRGVEAALQGSLQKLDWYANWTYLEASFEDNFKVLSPNHPAADAAGELSVQSGDRIPGQPRQLFKLGGDYSFNASFSLGAEVIYNAGQVVRGDESNELPEIAGYALMNLRASWQASEQFSVYARISNVFDTDYENFGLLGEDPTELLPALTDARPLFVGVGAPRAAWAGFRYRF